jgi:hypothetical protein
VHNVRTAGSTDGTGKDGLEASRRTGCVESLWGSNTDLTSCLVSTVLCVCKLFSTSSSSSSTTPSQVRFLWHV